MTDAGARPGRRKWGQRLLLAALAVLLGFGGLDWYVNTDSFQAMIRRRLVSMGRVLRTVTRAAGRADRSRAEVGWRGHLS
jgi:hypothetical protein